MNMRETLLPNHRKLLATHVVFVTSDPDSLLVKYFKACRMTTRD